MNETILKTIIIAIVFIFLMSFFIGRDQLSWPGKKMETTKICFEQNCFIAEVARTKTDRERGLMFRESLDLDKAMLFVFETRSVHSFWMKNCLISLDIIWLDEYYKVLAIRPNNKPCPVKANRLDFIEGTSTELAEECPSINPNVSAKYVLEINAGLSSKLNLAIGAHATLQPIDK